VILEELCARDTHPTATELHAAVRKRLPRISLGTVYRNLEVLCEDGLARKLFLAGTDARYDGLTHAHDHVRCTICGALQDFPGESRSATPVPREAGGFLIQGYRLEYYGLCAACRSHEPGGAIETGRP
jgi:Fur family ferric uptake transcriptional regulator